MAFVEKDKHISGNMVIDGTLTADQIKTDSLTANKFKGATEEQYFNFFKNQSVGFNTYVTLHEFDFPETELELVKSRNLEVSFDGYMYTGTSATVASTVYLYVEIKVPNEPTYRFVGNATHESYPVSGWQRVYIVGNRLNRFGLGQAGDVGSYRDYRNLKFIQNYPTTTNVISNSFFGSTANWTVVSGTFISEYGQYGRLQQDATTDFAHIYQQVDTVAGKTYQFNKTMYQQSTAVGRFHLSTSSDIADSFFYTEISSSGGTTTDYVKVDYDSVYVIIENRSSTNYDYIAVDNVYLYETEPRTYVDVSTAGGQAIYNTESLYFHPYGSAGAYTWKVVKTTQMSVRTNPYSHYFTMNANAYLGTDNTFLQCRVRARHFFSGDTLSINSGTVLMKSRMTGEQNE
jgi:hypothetical protein